jgi:hypothetical protein
MRVVKAESKDIWITLELPLREVMFLKDVLDHSEIVYDSNKEPEMEVANAFVKDNFYPLLLEIIKEFVPEE